MKTPHQPTLSPADVYLIIDNLDLALKIFRRHQGEKNQSALDVYLQTILTSLRRDLLQHALNLREAETNPGFTLPMLGQPTA